MDKISLILVKHPHAGVLLVGDFNRCPITRLCWRFNLKQIVKHPTRGNAILGYVPTNLSAYYNALQILPPLGSSDHNVIICIPLIPNCVNDVRKVLVRKRNTSAMNAFGRWLSSINWISLYHSTSCEDKLNILHDTIEAGMDLFFPSKLIKIHNRDKPWITTKFKNLIHDRQKAFHQGNYSLYKQLRNRANRETLKLRSSYLERKLNHLATNLNPKKWWDSVKELAGYNKKKQSPAILMGADNQPLTGVALANKINDEFSVISQEYTPLQQLPENSESTDLSTEYIISEKEIYIALSSLDISKSSGPDDIPIWVLKSYSSLLAWPITSIFNASIQCAHVPSRWKCADVIPIPKSHNATQSRPKIKCIR